MAASGSLKIPPPPAVAQNDPAFNRWLLEVTRILAAAGGIDPTQIVGWNELVAQVATNTGDIAALKNNILALTNTINLVAVRTTALEGRSQVFNGNVAPLVGLGVDNDWYYNRSGGAGARLYIKVAGAWAAQAI